ncbi:histidine phosphatase family protein [Candidatus Pelagibacter sp.]|nr:histidine phosphatase family protein [Candidatus Pelagibacter sp.]
MKFIKFLFIIFITIPSTIKADLNQNLISKLKEGGKVVLIRHAYAPGVGDPDNFDINDCDTQRNINESGKLQAKKIGDFFKINKISVDKVISSEWCRCKETAFLGFKNFETNFFLNSFYSLKFSKNRSNQMNELKKYIEEWESKENLILVTHYVVILELLGYATSSGEIVISNKNFKKIGSIEIDF